MLMGSSTASETTTNTSTDSSNTVYTMVTVTDAEAEERAEHDTEGKTSLKDERFSTKQKDVFEIKRDLKEQGRRTERKQEMKRREILSEFDELFLENEKRINAEKMLQNKGVKNEIKSSQQSIAGESQKGL